MAIYHFNAPQPTGRSVALITGAAGGMGRACARTFGETMDLLLVDIATNHVRTTAEELVADGYTVREPINGNICDPNILAQILEALAGEKLGVLIHAAGVSPSQAEWQKIMKVNLVATARLLHGIAPHLRAGTVGIVIASIAGHMSPEHRVIDGLMDDPLIPTLLEDMAPELTELAGRNAKNLSEMSFGYSKRGLIRLCRRLAVDWGAKGARIVSISPGAFRTNMGKQEAASNPDLNDLVARTPLGRWGMPMDVAHAARFLAAPEASYITGCDLRIDGGASANLPQ